MFTDVSPGGKPLGKPLGNGVDSEGASGASFAGAELFSVDDSFVGIGLFSVGDAFVGSSAWVTASDEEASSFFSDGDSPTSALAVTAVAVSSLTFWILEGGSEPWYRKSN